MAVRVYGDFAVQAGIYTFAWEERDGTPMEKRARFSLTFRREHPGTCQEWTIVEHHSSSMSTAPAGLKRVSEIILSTLRSVMTLRNDALVVLVSSLVVIVIVVVFGMITRSSLAMLSNMAEASRGCILCLKRCLTNTAAPFGCLCSNSIQHTGSTCRVTTAEKFLVSLWHMLDHSSCFSVVVNTLTKKNPTPSLTPMTLRCCTFYALHGTDWTFNGGTPTSGDGDNSR